jgi:class 3 adenylate cyclase
MEVQRALLAAAWPDQTGVLKVRMGLHTDEAVPRNGRYPGAPVTQCARLMAAAHGGQVLLSGATEALVRPRLPDGATLIDLGEHRLPDLAGPCGYSSSRTRTCCRAWRGFGRRPADGMRRNSPGGGLGGPG